MQTAYADGSSEHSGLVTGGAGEQVRRGEKQSHGCVCFKTGARRAWGTRGGKVRSEKT